MEQILLTKKITITEKTRQAGRRLLSLVWSRHRWVVLGGILCTLMMAVFTNAGAWMVKQFIDKALVGKNPKMLILYSALIAVLFLLRWPFSFLSNYLIMLGGMKVVEELRNNCYRSLQAMSFGYFEKQRTGELTSRISNDTGVVQMFVTSGINEMIKIPIISITALVTAMVMCAKLTLISLAVLPVIVGIITMANRRMKYVSKTLQEKIADLTIIMTEILSSMHVVKSFSMEEYELNRFALENRATMRATMRQVMIRAAYSPLVEFVGAAGLAFILWVGGRDVISGTPDFLTGRVLTPGSLLALFFLLQQISTQVNHISTVTLTLQHAYAAAERSFEIIDMQPDIMEKPDAVEIPEIKGNIEYKNVCFEYNSNEPVLKDVSLKMAPGMVVALVGSSGSGKSTFVKLLPRFYDVTGGSITIEGVDVRDARISSYRPLVGIVPQDTILFRATIKENISYGRIEAPEADIIEAAKAAYAHDFIIEMPEGYDTLVGERGVTLSGGQRQRIAIARAILKDPRILILDEATSNVDNVSEQYIQIALEKLMRNRTTLVIAHRLTTIRNADLILVLENGKIVERGNHSELYEVNGVYRHLYDMSQESKSLQ